VVQSCLHSMLSDGQGLNLARVRLIVLFACPNDGSQFLSPLRWVTRFLLRNPQEKGLLPLDARITDARLRPLTPVPSAATLTGIDAHRSIFGINGSEIVGVQFSDRDT
jgi:hypothetical protein